MSTQQPHQNFVDMAVLLGDPSRAMILSSLLDGRILPASDLARQAKITPQTVSSHLSKLLKAGIVSVEAHGRYRYYRLSSPEVAAALEGILAISGPVKIKSLREHDQMKAIHYARTCYDHLAGKVGVAVTESMLKNGLIQLNDHEKGYLLTKKGEVEFCELGIKIDELKHTKRKFARPCLDWSERRHHLAGSLGAALTSRLFELEWIRRLPGTRAVAVTDQGIEGFSNHFGVRLVPSVNDQEGNQIAF